MSNEIYPFLGLMQKSGNLSSGGEIVEKEIRKGNCLLLIIAEDASENTKKKFKGLAELHNINYVIFGNKEELGFFIGKNERSTLAVKDSGMAEALIKKIRAANFGGEINVKTENI